MPARLMREYMETRDVRKLQPYLQPTVKPTVFHVREVPHDLWESFVMAAPSEAERYRRAFMCGLESIDELQQNDGTSIPQWQPPRDASGVIRSEAIARVSAQEREEVGAVIWYHSFLPRRIDDCFALPPSSRAVLNERVFLRVDASPSSAASSSDAASSKTASTPPASMPTEPASATTGAGSDSPTAATAAEMPIAAAS